MPPGFSKRGAASVDALGLAAGAGGAATTGFAGTVDWPPHEREPTIAMEGKRRDPKRMRGA